MFKIKFEIKNNYFKKYMCVSMFLDKYLYLLIKRFIM